ncbi:MAG: DUF3047 domain-containing protein [Deltaproteobacteria bacterium]|nr:DUF3047 domain-containing protein [Deltaproteobacteria bacterium]
MSIAVLAMGARGATLTRVPLDVARFSSLSMGNVPPTGYRNAGSALVMRVRSSASFLLLPLATPQTVRGVHLRWRSTGRRDVGTAAEEVTKAGDDHLLRVGLMLAGDAPTVPSFAPAWVKAVRDRLTSPSNRMVQLVAGAHHAPGSWWKNPYAESIDCVALPTEPAGDGFSRSSIALDAPVTVVGLWLMADGDDSGSSFETTLADLQLE